MVHFTQGEVTDRAADTAGSVFDHIITLRGIPEIIASLYGIVILRFSPPFWGG